MSGESKDVPDAVVSQPEPDSWQVGFRNLADITGEAFCELSAIVGFAMEPHLHDWTGIIAKVREAVSQPEGTRCVHGVRLNGHCADCFHNKGTNHREMPTPVVSQNGNSRVLTVGNVSIGCMLPEARELLDVAMERYKEHRANVEKSGYVSDDQVYSFAYWLFRWSGLIPITAPIVSGQTEPSQQDVVTQWAIRCFGAEHVYDPKVRAVRLVEEAVEFAQSVGADPAQLQGLVDYVYNRAPGKPVQELGGVGVTLLAAASAIGANAEVVIAEEIARVLAKPEKHFTLRNQGKIDKGFTGAAPPSLPKAGETAWKCSECDGDGCAKCCPSEVTMPLDEFKATYPALFEFWNNYLEGLNSNALWVKFAADWGNSLLNASDPTIETESRKL